MKTLALFFAPFLFLASEAAAQFESDRVYAYKSWYVDLTRDERDGSRWCSAGTENRYNQTFSITTYENSQMALFVFDGSWDLSERPVRFLIDVDYDRWVIDGNANKIGVSLLFNEAEKTFRFLSQLQAANAVAVLNDDEVRLAVFSLAGSRRALEELMACWRAITTSDPFRSRRDPF